MKSKKRIEEWFNYCNGKVYVSFSGGKDSTVLLHLVRSLYPEVLGVYSDTGLEYPEIRQFVKETENIIIIRPKMLFTEVIQNYGYPIISKEIALTIYYARDGSQWAIQKLNGEHQYGNHKKYKYLLKSNFKISDKCCYIMKKKPFKDFEKETGLKPFIGTMASEGGQRESAYKKTGCNAFSVGKSMPIGFWSEKDIWEYIKMFNLPYSKIYDMGYERTGCMFCMFGVHLEKGKNRFQKMKITHPKQYDYCMNKLGLKDVLNYIKVDYE
jgi:3'-phosphoadenosine 5'-phosphosulfate sulfotransferase (PAPS reductase)/FAD synthetase